MCRPWIEVIESVAVDGLEEMLTFLDSCIFTVIEEFGIVNMNEVVIRSSCHIKILKRLLEYVQAAIILAINVRYDLFSRQWWTVHLF